LTDLIKETTYLLTYTKQTQNYISSSS